MKGDFSRFTFQKERHYTSVNMQQGRVQIDADWNEQQAINRYRTETEARHVIGASGAPLSRPGFQIRVEGNALFIGEGQYYAGGILCENEVDVTYEDQPHLKNPPGMGQVFQENNLGLVYLDVWMRNVTLLEDDFIREKALGGPDTATRTQTIWQVKVMPLASAEIHDLETFSALVEEREIMEKELGPLLDGEGKAGEINRKRIELAGLDGKMHEMVPELQGDFPFEEWKALPVTTGRLRARMAPQQTVDTPHPVASGGPYQQLENQLYLVEIHHTQNNHQTFKWSRENGSVVSAIQKIERDNQRITLSDVGRDEAHGFNAGTWAEMTSDLTELNNEPGPLVRIVNVFEGENSIEVEGKLPDISEDELALHRYKLRRWDQHGDLASEDGVEIIENEWIPLESGIEIQFKDGVYRSGDYWVIPARTVEGGIEWPPFAYSAQDDFRPPLGAQHHRDRLALIFKDADGNFKELTDCRKFFSPATELEHLFYVGGDGQIAARGQELTYPLQVGVESGGRPVPGAVVRFDVISGEGRLGLDSTDQASFKVMTASDGIAICRWRIDSETPVQQVRARLLDAHENPSHLPVLFTASVSEEAREAGITISEVCTLENQERLLNDSEISVDVFSGGLQIVCDGEVAPATIKRPTCFVSIELPLSDRSEKGPYWLGPEVGFQPLVLAGHPKAVDKTIVWEPDESLGNWLPEVLPKIIGYTREKRILARLTLKGNFIWEAMNSEQMRQAVYLDGDTFGTQVEPGRTDLILPSGDGRRGGDFQMWFWIGAEEILPLPDLSDIEIDPEVIDEGESSTGRLALSEEAPAGGVQVALKVSDVNVADVPGLVNVEEGQKEAVFQVNSKPVGAARKSVVISATLEALTKEAQLLVLPKLLQVTGIKILKAGTNLAEKKAQVLASLDVGDSLDSPLNAGKEDSPDAIQIEFSVPPDPKTISLGKTFIFNDNTELTKKYGEIILLQDKKTIRFRLKTAQKVFPEGTYSVRLSGDETKGINSQMGVPLDGEPEKLPSGNGEAGGDFIFQINIA